VSKTVLITGTTRGIGKATATVFAENDWRVIAHARTYSKEHERYCKDIGGTSIYFDMQDASEMKQQVRQLFTELSSIDALINNAGILDGGIFQMKPVARIREVFEVNLFAQMELTQLVLKRMAKSEASICNVASIAGVVPGRGNSAYGASKNAVIFWTKVLAAELLGRVRVNAVAPGLTDTTMAREATYAAKLNNELGVRLGKAEEIAQAIYFLSSEKASFISGQILAVDGAGHLRGGYSD
jgi:3-oxoacyl-[acyl-carrier protein] reductase